MVCNIKEQRNSNWFGIVWANYQNQKSSNFLLNWVCILHNIICNCSLSQKYSSLGLKLLTLSYTQITQGTLPLVTPEWAVPCGQEAQPGTGVRAWVTQAQLPIDSVPLESCVLSLVSLWHRQDCSESAQRLQRPRRQCANSCCAAERLACLLHSFSWLFCTPETTWPAMRKSKCKGVAERRCWGRNRKALTYGLTTQAEGKIKMLACQKSSPAMCEHEQY
jgi:hypothetical protein